MSEYLAVGLGGAAALGQLLNYILHLRLKSAILESEQKTLEKVDQHYVRNETCQAAMRWQEERR